MRRAVRVPDRRLIGEMLAAIVASRCGISLQSLAGACDVDRATIKRRIAALRLEYGAPIISDRNGYRWSPLPEQKRRADALITVFCEEPIP